MIKITKEWLQQTIAEFENTRDHIPFGLEEGDAKNTAGAEDGAGRNGRCGLFRDERAVIDFYLQRLIFSPTEMVNYDGPESVQVTIAVFNKKTHGAYHFH